MRVLRWSGNVLIVLGATMLFFVFYEVFGTALTARQHQDALASTFDNAFERPAPVVVDDPTVASPSPKPIAGPRGGPDPIARIRIPTIGVKQIVVEGVSLDDLAWGPGHYPSSSPPGGAGVTAIAGHRTGWGSPFIDLDKLRPGQRVLIDTPEATYVYEMTGSKVVDPDQTKVLLGDPKSDATHKLTLTTCTPKYTSLRRLIVWGDLVEVIPRT